MQTKTPVSPLYRDLEHILYNTDMLWEDVRKKSIFVTGGTGFFGKWLMESFIWANERFKLQAQMLVLSRDPDSFLARYPRLAKSTAIKFLRGDVRTFVFPKNRIDFIIHAATDADETVITEKPLLTLDTIIKGTRRSLEFACENNVKRLLLVSSGAVYGKQPSDFAHTVEDYPGAPSTMDPHSVYGEAKRIAELMGAVFRKQYGLRIIIARCFAFVGPYLNLNIHYAIGNFIRDGLAGGPIHVTGDGTPYRSYLYAADLAIWLWTLLLRGHPGEAYNVGSENALSIKELAYEVRNCFSRSMQIVIDKPRIPSKPAERYVPSTIKAREELKLDEWTNLKDAIKRTIEWHSNSS